jgi:hypothetical protein
MRPSVSFFAGTVRATAAVFAACLFAGCASNNAPRPVEDPRTAEPAYWLAQPPTTTVVSDDFHSLWRACRSAAVGHSFTVDRVDFRSGLMTTLPLVSKQFFEFWRNDVVTPRDLAESSLHSVRRTERFEVRRLDDGRYEAVPKVLLERYSFAERRVTSVARFAEVFTTEQVEGSRARDRLGGDLPETYWYAAGRDRALEKALADSIRRDLRA